MKLTIPHHAHAARIVLIPVLALVFYIPAGWTSVAAAFDLRRWLRSPTGWMAGSRAATKPVFGVRRLPRPGRGQADGGDRAVPDRAGHPTRGWRCGRRSSSAAKSRCRRCANGWRNRPALEGEGRLPSAKSRPPCRWSRSAACCTRFRRASRCNPGHGWRSRFPRRRLDAGGGRCC